MVAVLVGRSASGKDTIKKELLKKGMNSIVTHTTRPPRNCEEDGIAYHFISVTDFFEKELNGYFAETTSYETVHGRWYYGTSIESLKNAPDNTVIILNPDGLRAVKNIEGLDVVSFYVKAKKSVLKKRLKSRGDNRKEAKRRMREDKKDFRNMDFEVDYTIDNNGNKSIEELVNTIQFLVNERRGEKNTK